MVVLDKEEFLKASAQNTKDIYDAVLSAGPISLKELPAERTALMILDMVNGFVKKGALFSPNVLAINEGIARLLLRCNRMGIRAVCFADRHPKESPEFRSFPEHCLGGTDESRVTDELAAGSFTLIFKNSTNAFLEPEFAAWLRENDRVDTFLIAGCCTDLCVQQFALTLKAEFNRRNRTSRVIVPAALVATYDAPCHNASFMDFVSVYNMLTCGVEVTVNFQY